MLTKSDLHQYQVKAVNHIIANRGCALFLDMGLGKTVSTLTAIEILLTNNRISKPLIIAPKRVAESTWTDELQKWQHLCGLTASKILGTVKQRKAALNAKADIYIINRDNVTWLVDQCRKDWPFDMVVIDELSSFKTPRSKRFKSLKSILGQVGRVVGLTGTPSPNGYMDLWSQIYLLDRGERLEKTVTAYRNIYFTPGRSNGHIVYEYRIRPYAEEIINRRIADICLSMQAKDYLQLPEAVYNVIRVYLPDDLLKRYKAFEREKIMELGDAPVTATNAGVLVGQLRQFASGAMYDDVGSSIYTEIHDYKIEALKEIAESAESLQSPILVGYEFKHDYERIKKSIPQFTKIDTPADIRKWNAREIPVAGGHPASMGHGLNLQKGGNQIVWFTLPWSLELYQQFNARLYRQGQDKPVIINHLICAGTVDERVFESLQSKEVTQQTIIDTIKALRDEANRNSR